MSGPNMQPVDHDVSIIALVATPERFDGKLVRVVGWAIFAFESQGIFVARERISTSALGCPAARCCTRTTLSQGLVATDPSVCVEAAGAEAGDQSPQTDQLPPI